MCLWLMCVLVMFMFEVVWVGCIEVIRLSVLKCGMLVIVMICVCLMWLWNVLVFGCIL